MHFTTLHMNKTKIRLKGKCMWKCKFWGWRKIISHFILEWKYVHIMKDQKHVSLGFSNIQSVLLYVPNHSSPLSRILFNIINYNLCQVSSIVQMFRSFYLSLHVVSLCFSARLINKIKNVFVLKFLPCYPKLLWPISLNLLF